MSLFELKEMQDAERIKPVNGYNTSSEIVNGASIKSIKKFFANIEPHKHYHFWTGGQWNMHDLLVFMLSVTGPAKVYFTTWSISEDAVRVLLKLKETELITDLTCVLDYKAKEQKTNAFLLAKSNFNVSLTPIHAKVTVLVNDNWKVCITGSANWTRNPRAERQLICTVPEIVDEDIKTIEALARGEKPFKVR